MTKKVKRGIIGLILVCTVILGMNPNIPVFAGEEVPLSDGTEATGEDVFWAATEEYWAAEEDFWTAVDNFYGNDDEEIEGALPKYYAAVDSNESEDTVRKLYSEVSSTRGAVLTAYEKLKEKYEAVTEAYDAIQSEEIEGADDSIDEIKECYEEAENCLSELEEPDRPEMCFYWNAESAYWDELDSFWSAVGNYYGDEENDIVGALQEYNDALDNDETDMTAVLELYNAALDARGAVVEAYEVLSEKYTAVVEAYDALSEKEKAVAENHSEIVQSYPDAEGTYNDLETFALLDISEESEVQISGDAPEIVLNSDTADVLEKVDLTQEEKRAIYNGESTDIIMTVTDVEPTTEEEKLIGEKLGDYTVAQYLDIELLLKIGNNSRKIEDTAEAISISITIPDNLLNKNAAIERTYGIIRIHDGIATVIDGKYDASSGKLTFATDKFSIYAIIYKDEKVENPTSPVNPTNPTNPTQPVNSGNTINLTQTPQPAASQVASPKTGDDFPVVWVVMILLAAAVAVGISGEKVFGLMNRR